MSWGESYRVGFLNRYVYAATSDGIKILDISDFAQPEVKWEIENPGGVPVKSTASGDLLAIVDDNDRLSLLKLEPEGEPETVGEDVQLSGNVIALSLRDTLLAVSSLTSGVELFYLDWRYSLRQIEFEDSSLLSQNTGDVLFADNLLFCLKQIHESNTTDVVIVDLSRPQNPQLESSISIEGMFDNLKYSNYYLYLGSNSSNVLTSVDVRAPHFPEISHRFTDNQGNRPTRAMQLWGPAPGEWEFALRLNNSIVDIDQISTPSEIQHYNTIQIGVNAVDIAVRDTIMAVVSSNSMIKLIDFNERFEIENVLVIDKSTLIGAITYLNGYVYAFDGNTSVISVDFNDILQPEVVRSVIAYRNIAELESLGNSIYCRVQPAGGGRLGIGQDAFSPIREFSNMTKWDFSENRMVIVDGGRLAFFEIEPAFRRNGFVNFDFIQHTRSVCWNGNYVYAVAGDTSLFTWVLDASTYNRIRVARRDPLDFEGFKFIEGRGNNLVMGSEEEVRLYDISEPLLIVEQSRWNSNGPISDLLVYNNTIIYADSSIHVVDISDPVHPSFDGYFTDKAKARDLLLDPNGMLIASEGVRVSVYDISAAVSVSNQSTVQPSLLSLSAFPNPFNSSTTISYSLPSPGRYAIDIVDIQGRLVTRLSDGWREAGSYREVWNGGGITSGQYVVRLNSNKESFSRPVTIIK